MSHTGESGGVKSSCKGPKEQLVQIGRACVLEER